VIAARPARMCVSSTGPGSLMRSPPSRRDSP
jgi:hypothetical protein